MAAASLPDILDRCLDDIRDGRATLDECLARYPEFRADLEPLLQVAASIAPLPSLPDPARKLAARVRFVEALHAEPDKASLGERVRRLFRPSPSFRLGRPGLASVAIVAALFSTTGVLYASEQALPGAPLYGIKLAVEQVRLSAALNDEITAQVKMEIAERRLAEVERAAAMNDTTALQLAAEYYARAVDDASATLDRIPPSDLAVIDRIQDNLQHQQDVLSRVADSAPAITKDSLDRAQQQARTGLERAAAVGGGARGSSAAPGRATPTPTVRPTSPPPTATTRITGQIGATSAATAVVILPTALPTAIPSGDASEVATPPPRPSATSARPATPDPTATARRPTPRPAREDDEDDTEQATPIPLITAPAGTALPIMTRVPVETGRRDSENEADHRDHDDGDEGENHRNPTAAPATAPALATIIPPPTPRLATAVPPTAPAVASPRPPLVPTARIDNPGPGQGPTAPIDPQPPVPPTAPEPPGRSDEPGTSGRRSGEDAGPGSAPSSGRNPDSPNRRGPSPPEPPSGGMRR